MPSNGTEFISSYPKIGSLIEKNEMKGHTETQTARWYHEAIFMF
jgi:hypothetical protein